MTDLVDFPDGYVIHGEFGKLSLSSRITDLVGKLPLIIADPPYGNIVANDWDKTRDDYHVTMVDWAETLAWMSLPGAALYLFGGIGRPKDRQFFKSLVGIEENTEWQMSTLVTWKKKRAYGIQWGYLFVREEIAYFTLGDPKSPRKFDPPYLGTKRGYAGMNLKYPAKSEYYRRTNVWDDVTEILQGKVHVAQKPAELLKIPILAHTEPGEYVLDPFAGSGSTAFAARALGRKFVLVERDKDNFDRIVYNLKSGVKEPRT